MTGPEHPPVSLLHAVTPWVIDQPEREAMAFGDVRLTYGDMAAHALSLANRLQGLGVRPGDRVAAGLHHELPHIGRSLPHPQRTPQLRHGATIRANLGFVLEFLDEPCCRTPDRPHQTS